MKTLACVAVFVCLTFGAAAFADSETPQITVFGTATKTVKPDTLNWHLVVTRQGSELTSVATAHTKDVSAAVSLIRSFGVDEDDIQTSNMQFGQHWVFRDGSRVPEGYIARTYMTFETGDLGAYVSMWSRLAASPGVSVANVSLDHSERIRYRDEAQSEALLAARAKARAMAAALDSALGVPLDIEEQYDDYRPYQANVMSMAADSGAAMESGTLAPGMIEIQARVRVTFALRNQD